MEVLGAVRIPQRMMSMENEALARRLRRDHTTPPPREPRTANQRYARRPYRLSKKLLMGYRGLTSWPAAPYLKLIQLYVIAQNRPRHVQKKIGLLIVASFLAKNVSPTTPTTLRHKTHHPPAEMALSLATLFVANAPRLVDNPPKRLRTKRANE